MKVQSVAILVAVGMIVAGLTAWSLASRSGGAEPEPAPPAMVGGPWSAPDLSRFNAGGTLAMEGRLGNARLFAGRDNHTYLSLSVRATDDTRRTTRTPLDLAIVIDRSGSMRGKRLENAIAAAQGMIRRLRNGDVVSVVEYNTRTRTLVPPTTIDAYSRERAARLVSGLEARGGTCISCGIDAGMDQLRRRSGTIERMLLLSDGEATAGVRDVEGFARIASTVRHLGAAISTIGVDVDYNERVMTALAQESNGQHYFVEDPSGLPRVFDHELESLVHTVAKDATVTVALAPGIEVERVFDRSFRHDGDRIVVPMGSFAAGDTKTLLMRVHVPRGAVGERAVADVTLDYDDLDEGSSGTCRGSLSTLLVDDPSRASGMDPLVRERVERSETASTLGEANKLFSSGNAALAGNRLRTRIDALRRQRAVAERSAPASRKAEVAADFARQELALDDARRGFAKPAAAAAPAKTHAGKAQVRRNAADAFELRR